MTKKKKSEKIREEVYQGIQNLKIPSTPLPKKAIKRLRRRCKCGRRVATGHHKYCERCWKIHDFRKK